MNIKKYINYILLILISSPVLSEEKKLDLFKICDSIEIQNFDSKKTITITNKETIQLLVAVLNSNTKTEDHKCESVASLILKTGNSKVELNLLPGHDANFYEFRYNGGIYKINRAELLKIKDIKDNSLVILNGNS